MNEERKICVITGTRAEYGLLYWLMREISEDSGLSLQLVVTGMHLSPEFGLTYKLIEQDGFKIDKKVEMLLSSDTPNSIAKSIGLAQIGFADTLTDLSPDLIVILGDRYEIFAAAATAMVLRIPLAHLHGGESTEGLIDEPIRHSITKMSHLHFTAAEGYMKRVTQLGEQPEYVFNVGGLGIDNILQLELLSKKELESQISFNFGELTLMVTFHPVTLDKQTAELEFKELLSALDQFQNARIIFTKANSDTDGRIINSLIDEYALNNKMRVISFTTMGQLKYLSALKYVHAVIGNSSSGLIEAPSFQVPTVNIGDRQRGRIKAESVIDCIPEKIEIVKAIEKAVSSGFQKYAKTVKNPYGTGGAAKKIVQTLKKVNLKGILKKKFYNLGSEK